MTKDTLKDDLQLAGFLVSETHDGRMLIEGISDNKVNYLIEEDFDAFWLYEYTGYEFHSVDAFGILDQALEAGKKL